MRRQAMDQDKICAKDASGERLLHKICKELLKFNNEKISNLIKKWGKDFNRHVTKNDMQVASQYMKKCSTSHVIREMQIKTRYYFTCNRMSKIQNTNTTRCWQGCGVTGTLIYCWWECRKEEPLWQFLTKLNILLPLDPAIMLLGIYPEELKIYVPTKTCTQMFKMKVANLERLQTIKFQIYVVLEQPKLWGHYKDQW